jgi:hypothetical protein
MTVMAETLAKTGSWCPLCRTRIVAGEHYIAKPRKLQRWCHSECAKGYEAAMAENAEAGEAAEAPR